MLINPFAGLDFGFFKLPFAHALNEEGEEAGSPDKKTTGIIAIVAEESLMQNLDTKNRIMEFAFNTQQRIPLSRSFVLTVKNDQAPFEIATVLEKIYFEGIDQDLIDNNPLNNLGASNQNNHLIGAVLIGDIPLPVISEEGKGLPSLFPYTDFHEKAYPFNHLTQRFEKNDAVAKPLPEIWHGVIRSSQSDPDVAQAEIIEFLDKNKAYSEGDSDYTDFDQRILYADFTAIEEQMNMMDFRNYERYSKYMEEMSFKRFNKYLLGEIIKEVSADMGSQTPIMSEEALAIRPDISVEFDIRQYVKSFAESMQTYLGDLNQAMEETGRWDGRKMDSLIGLITVRDKYAKSQLLRKQLQLEKAIDLVVRANNQNISLPSQTQVTVHLTISGVTNREETFTVPAFIDGQRVNDMVYAEQCGFHLGQERQPDQTVLENNSVFIEANPVNNPNTLIIPPENLEGEWLIKQETPYVNNGGCLFNNFNDIDTDGDGELNLGPGFCRPKAARIPLLDVVGGKEIPVPEFEKNGARCDIERISFLPDTHSIFDQRLLNPVFAVEILGETLNVLGLVDPDIFNPPIWQIVQWIYTQVPGGDPTLTTQEKLTELVFLLSQNGEVLEYKPNDLVKVEMWVIPWEEKEINSAIRYTQPTPETMKTLKGVGEPTTNPETGQININMSTFSIPADGIRQIYFMKDDEEQKFVYPNLFKIKGDNEQEVQENFLKTLAEKEAELQEQLGIETNVITDFFSEAENISIIEPLSWVNLKEDQKLERIIEKYTNRDSFLPTPSNTVSRPPRQKPKGYEVLHIVAEGDAQGYEFGLKNAMLPKINKSKVSAMSAGDEEEQEGAEAEGEETEEDDSENPGPSVGGNDYQPPPTHVCGDLVNGVEIWEWFSSLQCWLEEEILVAEKLVTLDYTYSEIPEVNYEIEDETVPNVLEEIDPVVSEWRVTMNKRNLVPGQPQTIEIEALDDLGQPIFGYIKNTINLSLSDPQLGTFDKNDFNVIGAKETVTFTAQNPGSGQLIVQPAGEEAVELPITVESEINVDWNSVEVIEGGISRFEAKLELTNGNGDPLTNVNGELYVGPRQPADGGFVEKGKVEIRDGKGTSTFYPIPGQATITLASKDPYYKGEHIIEPSPPQASEIRMEQQETLNLDEKIQILVKATDPRGYVDENYNENVAIQILNESSGGTEQIDVSLNEGEGSFEIESGKETGILKLKAQSNGIQGENTINILARVESTEIEDQFSQSLFVSLVGFPAGNVFEENYLGGEYLFNGKTQTVFSFLDTGNIVPTVTVSPQYKITLTQPNQKVYAEANGQSLLLQVFDQKELKTLLSKTIPWNFNQINVWNEEDFFEEGNAYLLQNDQNYQLKEGGNSLELLDTSNQLILTLTGNEFKLMDATYTLEYNDQSEFDLVELELRDKDEALVATLFLKFSPENLTENSFEERDPNLAVKTLFGGSSTSDARGLMLYDPQNQEGEALGEFYGLQGENVYLKNVASGLPMGEAVRMNLDPKTILLGDPTISLAVKSNSNLNYDYSSGQKIYEDLKGSQVVSMTSFDFDNDGDKDIGLALSDGRIRLLEKSQSTPIIRDVGDIAYLADGSVAIETFDFEDDGYEDLLVATKEGRLAILHNQQEMIIRENQELNIGKQLYSIKKADMDQDGYPDLVALDSRGDILIFYYNPDQKKFNPQGQKVDNFGFSLKLGENLSQDLKVRYSGITEPASFSDQLNEDLDPAELFELQNAQAQAARENPEAAAQIPTLPWPEGEESSTYFEAADNLSFLTVNKTVQNLDRPGEVNLDLEERLKYTLQISANQFMNNLVIADTIPDALELDLESVQCVSGCSQMEKKNNEIYLFMSGLTLSPGQTIEITYEVSAAHTPQADIEIQTLTTPLFLADEYPDILVSPPYNPTSDLIQLYSTGPKTYAKRTTEEDGLGDNNTNQLMSQLTESTNALGDFNMDAGSSASGMPAIPGAEEAVEEVTGKGDCFESADSPQSCTSAALDKVAEGLSEFNCSGGGCFPTPWNQAFLVPPAFPLPLFAFPTTLPTPIGPMPFIWPGSLIGAANIPGPIISMIRFYLSPTLTGGLAIAMCWGPYNGYGPAPPPLVPIPYPPPAGNCIVKALPVSALPWGGVCKQLEKSMNKLTDVINSGVGKINTAITNNVNNNPSVPLDIMPANSQQGAGGLEVSLGINLGQSMTYEPPVKGFSNIHLPTFDSVLGKVADWTDRQFLEISNKLFRLPTFSIYLPDVETLFTRDFKQTQRQAEAWFDTLSKSTEATFVGSEGEKSVLEKISESDKPDARKTLDKIQAVEMQASIYNINSLQGIYDIASTLPILNITERPIDFEIPWLSAAEIQAYIIDMQQWVIYYEKEFARVKDKWEAISCPSTTDSDAIEAEIDQRLDEACKYASSDCNTPERRQELKRNELAKAASACAARQLGDKFLADFNEVKQSVQENIQILQSYLTFPKKLIKYKGQLAAYLYNVAGYIDTIAQTMGGWHATIREQLISWAELGYTIEEIAKNWRDIFDVFVSFDQSCATCSNDRFSNFGYWSLLGVILPELPIITFPRLPDIVLDLSNLDRQINLEIPIINIQPNPIPLPPLPYVRLPDLPDVSLLLQVPPLPVLPRLPDPPDLPDMPPLPLIDLPTLPPPPKLPDVGKSFEVIIPIIEQVLNVWCLAKKGLSPIPEVMLNDQISLLTNRPAYLTPLDLLQAQAPNITGFDLGFSELRVETTNYLGIRFEALPQALQDASDQWNEWAGAIPEGFDKFYDLYLASTEGFIQEVLDEGNAFLEEEFKEFEETANQTLDLNNSALGSTLFDANEWLRDREAALEKMARALDLDLTYEKYVKGIQILNQKVEESSEQTKESIQNWFENNNDILGAISTIVFFAPKALDSEELAEVIQIILQETNDALGAAANDGPAAMYKLLTYIRACLEDRDECKNSEDYFGMLPKDVVEPSSNKQLASVNNLPLAEETYSQNFDDDSFNNFETNQLPAENQLQTLTKTMIDVFNKVNEAEWVDYEIVKNDLGVQDVTLKENRENAATKMRNMADSFYKESRTIEKEMIALKDEVNLYAFANVGPRPNKSYELASDEELLNTKEEASAWQPFVNEVQAFETISLKNQPETQIKALDELAAAGFSGPCTAGLCLPDPVTQNGVPVVPVIEQLITSETVFLPNGHLVYSDGDKVYLKEDLVEKSQKPIQDLTIKALNLDESFLKKIGQPPYLMESVNMLQSTLSENSVANFKWNEVTHPDLYGYGIEIERSVKGWDAANQKNELTDISLVLLPKEADGSLPEILVDNQSVPFDSLITSLTGEKEEIEKTFGIKVPNIVTGRQKVTFPSINGAEIVLNDKKAVYVKLLEGENLSLQMENGFYQIRARWFTSDAWVSMTGHSELLAPQSHAKAAPPIALGGEVMYVPVYKEKQIQASELLIDLGSNYQYAWFAELEKGILTPSEGETFILPAQSLPKDISVTLIASQDLEDKRFERFERSFKVNVYAPPIILDEAALKEGVIKGKLENIPEAPEDDLSGIPFSVFRKRWNTWKNIGQISGKEATLASASLNVANQSYQTLDHQGNYEISDWIIDEPSPVILKDTNADLIASVKPVSGQIELTQENYFLKALPATSQYPTRIGILQKESEAVAGNVYYVARGNTDVQILQGSLSQASLNPGGVTVGDLNLNDDIIVKNLPIYAPSFPGGVSIFTETSPQKNIALVDKSGSIRLMQSGYELKLKDQFTKEGNYIFQLAKSSGEAVFDIFIDADFNQLQIVTDETMDASGAQIGMNGITQTAIASLSSADDGPIGFAQANQSLPNLPSVPANQSSAPTEQQDAPFSDLDESHPYYQQILELYENRIVEGFEDGTFKPDEKLSRAEFVKIALGVTNCIDCTKPTDPQKERYNVPPFPDVNLADWYYYCISIAKELGMITGYGDGFFKPEQNISRAEAVAVILRETNVPLQQAPEGSFLDVADYAWYKDYVYTAVQMELIKNNLGFVFPNEQITRGEFAFMAAKVMGLQQCREIDADLDGLPDFWEMLNNLDPLIPDATEGLLEAYKEEDCPCADNPNQNDTDGDGKRDVCDDDIDGDGIGHPVCILFDDDGFVIESQLLAIQKTPGIDNCIFQSNPDQQDSDGNGIGDVCELQDLCPNIPEDADGVDDEDGCPEVEVYFPTKNPGIYVNKGPLCQLIDYEAELMEGDVIMTAITDLETHSVIYSQSNEVSY